MKRLSLAQVLLAVALLGSIVAVTAQQVFAAPKFADEAFARVWNREDRAVVEGVSQFGRSWTWGPTNLTESVREEYKEGKDGTRLVQYFDKSRMEINKPDADPNARFYVTNGLLPIEMMTGQLQTGDNSFETRSRATISAVGDPNQFPTYADLSVLYLRTPETDAEGTPVTRLFTANGIERNFNTYASDPRTFLGAPQGPFGYRVPQVFTNFQNLQDFVFVNNQYVFGPLFDPLFVFGHPVTDAYWVRTKVSGKDVNVLFQVFERRVLTYNPNNDPAFQVEMGNVGQHYYTWRYGAPTSPTPTPSPTTRPYPNP